MGRYRKKPVAIEAWRFLSPNQFEAEAPEWLRGQRILNVSLAMLKDGHVIVATEKGSPVLFIGTLEGIMGAQPGDWIIRGVKGELYPCKPDIFEATYEPSD